MKLQVLVGPNRFNTSVAHVNDSSRPTLIDTPEFVGRVMVWVKDFEGVAPPGEERKRDSEYFNGRSRKFAILIEGRFKARPGVEPYSGDEIHFGSDFDFLPASFPHGPFNVGMRIAQMVDPATFFDETPPSGRPYIMSPWVACTNTFCAYPAPSALDRAVLLANHDARHPHHAGEVDGEATFVPVGEQRGTAKRVVRNHWRFVGLRGDPRVDEFVKSHEHLLAPEETTLKASNGTRPPLAPRAFSLGTTAQEPDDSSISGIATPVDSDVERSSSRLWGGIPLEDYSSTPPRPSTPTKATKKQSTGSRFSLATLGRALGTPTNKADESLHEGDLISGEVFKMACEGTDDIARDLGPWRFGEKGVDAVEDTTFVFLDPEHERSVPQRRKHFVTDGGKFRKEFRYDPDIVYAGSFFTPFCDLNTFDLKMGPLSLNIAKHFELMPIRYTLRSTRMVPRADGKDGPLEEECFATISFKLVE